MKQEFVNEKIYYHKTQCKKETILQSLRERGYRITKQRQILLDIILEQDCTSCKEIFYKGKAVDPSMGISTVYRMVSVLEEMGVFDRKDLYKISYCLECNEENACRIVFEDGTVCLLSVKEWYEVITKGLEICGHSLEKKILKIELEPCRNDCNN